MFTRHDLKVITISMLCGVFVLATILSQGKQENTSEKRKGITPNEEVLRSMVTPVPEKADIEASSRIYYMREEIPDFKIPLYTGERYKELVPDTLDIAERSKLAIHGLTNVIDPDSDYDGYTNSALFCNPPRMFHMYSDVNCITKYYEALPLLRNATGSHLNLHVDRAWMEVNLKSIGPDGLYYTSIRGRPWLEREDLFYTVVNPSVCWEDGVIETPRDRGRSLTEFTEPLILGRMIATMTIYYLRDKDPMWDQTIKKMIDRISDLIIDKGDYGYIPCRIFIPESKLPPDAEMPLGMLNQEYVYRFSGKWTTDRFCKRMRAVVPLSLRCVF